MIRYALVYGSLSGAVMLAVIVASITILPHEGFLASEYFGYLVMLIAFMLIFVGLKRYRDVERGGVIRFLPALGVAALIALVACLVYTLVWEGYLAATGYTFFDEYAANHLANLRTSGASAAKIAEDTAMMEWGRGIYAHWYTRMAFTLMEPLPVAVLVPLVSAALLRNPRFLPATR
jgi:hypothetical protein